MSRIGKQPINLPSGVTISETDGVFYIKGPKGELFIRQIPNVSVSIAEGKITFTPLKKSKAFWGLARALMANAVRGVVSGYEKQLQIEGIGYRGEVKGKEIIFNLGFSH